MQSEVNTSKTERLYVRLDRKDIEQWVRTTMNLDSDWLFEDYNETSDGIEVTFEKFGSETRERP